MVKSAHFSYSAPIFQGKQLPEHGTVVGYASIIQSLMLEIPVPRTISIISNQNRKYQQEGWLVFPKIYQPNDSFAVSELEALFMHLVFALKYEGVNLLVFKKLAEYYSIDQLHELSNLEPTGQYSRRIWFLIEWLGGFQLLRKKDLEKKGYVKLVNDTIQYAIEGTKSPRHRIINNLPGTVDFCPLISKTEKLEHYIHANLADKQTKYLNGFSKDILQRASSFLLLKDSKASFSIEGESPKSKRAVRWGQAIGQAGLRDLSKEELLRLQQLVIENPRFLELGFRTKGGFVGEHDRSTGEPIPDHISARWEDIDKLISGLLETDKLLLKSDMNPVLVATAIAFGFVFIHPFEDGNGRIHRYLIHHVLSKMNFSQQGIIFPVSAAILDKIHEYRKVLESYSLQLLDFIQWEETKDHNVKVLSQTTDFYRYFDATKQAEFLFDCVEDTIVEIIPREVEFLKKYDEFKRSIENDFEMPDKLISLLVNFLEQNDGILSKRARENEFANLNDQEVQEVEKEFERVFR